jgi:hypothetical protein
MADEINLSVSMNVSKGVLQYNFSPPAATINLVGNAASGGVQLIQTATEACALVDVTTRGMANFINLTSGTKVEVGSWDGSNFNSFGELRQGEPAVLRLSATTTTSPVLKVIEPTNGTAFIQWQVFAD